MKNRQGYALTAQILFASFGRGGVIFNLETRESHRLNPTAAKVVALLDGHRRIGTIIDILSQENDVKAAVLKADVECFIEDIMNRGWLNDR